MIRESSIEANVPPSEGDEPANANDPEVASLLAILRRINAGSPSLPPRPEVVAEIMTLMQDARADSKRLARLVHGDPSLAAHVLRVANSPAWRGRARIVNLQQAVTRLGMGALQEIVLSAAIAGVYQVKGYEDLASSVWRHAIGTALFAKATARLRGENVEAAFISGLLHSVGRPVALWELLRQIKRRRMNSTPTAVRAAVDLGQQRVGSALAASWKLPEVVRTVIAHFDDPSQAPLHQSTTYTVAFGAEVTLRALNTMPDDLIPENPDLLQPFQHSAALGLYPDQVIQILQQTPKVISAIRAMSA